MTAISLFRRGAQLVALSLLCACGGNGSPAAAVSPGATSSPQLSPGAGAWAEYSGSVFSIQYPKGWVDNVSASGANATFTGQDRNISVRIIPGFGQTPTTQSVTSEVEGIRGAKITVPATEVTLPGGMAVTVTYEILGPVEPTSGRKPGMAINHYELVNSGRVAILDLAAPVGADIGDAYLAIAKSFRWTG